MSLLKCFVVADLGKVCMNGIISPVVTSRRTPGSKNPSHYTCLLTPGMEHISLTIDKLIIGDH